MSHSLPTIRVANEQFEAEILLQGAQLMHFAPRGQKPWVFQNAQTPFTPAAEIFAGVPLVFPWFARLQGQPDAPNHGFARQANWTLESQSDECVSLVLGAGDVRKQGLASPYWDFEFRSRMSFWFGDSLRIRFEVENLDARAFEFECAFHPYFAVSDVRATAVEGVPDGVSLGRGEAVAGGSLAFPPFGARLFLDSSGPVFIREPQRTFRLENGAGWRSTVVWNSGQAMNDLNDGDWPRFVCVESGALRSNAVSLEAGAVYALDTSVFVD